MGWSRYGFLELAQRDQAEEAIRVLNNTRIEDATISVKFAQPKPSQRGGGVTGRFGANAYSPYGGSGAAPVEPPNPSRLFICNIGCNATLEQVRAEFEKFGKVTSAAPCTQQLDACALQPAVRMAPHRGLVVCILVGCGWCRWRAADGRDGVHQPARRTLRGTSGWSTNAGRLCAV